MSNIAYYRNSRIVVECESDKEYLLKQIKGSRKVRGRYYVPLYQSKKIAKLEEYGFNVDSYIHRINIPKPETKVKVSDSYVEVSFPRSRALSATARELGGLEVERGLPGRETYLFGIEKKEEVLRAFQGLDSDTPIQSNGNSTERIDTQKVLNFLGDLSKPRANNWTLFEHQRDSVRQLLQTEYKGKVLALDFGLGKSFTSAVVAGAIQRVYDLDVLILTPASLMENWERETDNLISNPIIISDHFSKIPDDWNKPFLLLCDEAHRLAGHSKRAENFIKLASKSKFVIPITGSPVRHGNPATAYNLLKAINHPLTEMDRNLFSIRFGSAEANQKRFWALSKSGIIYKKKRDCLDLPKRSRVIRKADVDSYSNELYAEYFEKAKQQYIDAARRGEKRIKYLNSALVHYVRQAASLGKVPTAVSITEELLEQNRPVVLFAGYKKTVELLTKKLNMPTAEITGRIPVKDRQQMVDEFQNGDRRVAICSFGAAGYGITLTASSDLVLIDRPFSVDYNDVDNAASRVDRISQENPVTIVWLQFVHNYLKSPDIRLDGMIIRKAKGNQLSLTGESKPLEFANQYELGDYMAHHLFST